MIPALVTLGWLVLVVLLAVLVLLVVRVRAQVNQTAAALSTKIDGTYEDLVLRLGGLRQGQERDVDAAVTVLGAQIAALDVRPPAQPSPRPPAEPDEPAPEEGDEEAATRVLDRPTMLSIAPPRRRS